MPITKEEAVDLLSRFHDVTTRQGDAAAMRQFFLYPDARIFVPHGTDLELQDNYEIHQRLTDERHMALEPWDIIPLCDDPERVRAIGAIYWQGRLVDSAENAVIKCVVGEDLIIQRMPSGELKFVLY